MGVEEKGGLGMAQKQGMAQEAEAAGDDRDKPRPARARQAVIIVHGMGEPAPMETMRGFVEAVWRDDPELSVTEREIWSRPSTLTGSHEMRFLTTTGLAGETRVYTDFYEFYWADLMVGNRLADVTAWAAGLLLRRPSQVPENVRGLWWGLVGAVALFIAGTIFAFLTDPTVHRPVFAGLGVVGLAGLCLACLRFPLGPLLAAALVAVTWFAYGSFPVATLGAVLVLLGLLSSLALNAFVIPYFGDVARYVRRAPPNIAARRNVRERGLALLKGLHDAKSAPDVPRYDRIVIAAHSLGAIVAYDLITHFFADREEMRVSPDSDGEHKAALLAVETAMQMLAAKPDGRGEREALQAAQRRLFKAMADGSGERRWLISDFVTMGAPLAHAPFLLARDVDDLKRRQAEREFPLCPPLAERLWKKQISQRKQAGAEAVLDAPSFNQPAANATDRHGIFHATGDGARLRWRMHHAAPFAVVRWINFHDDASAGDIHPIDGDFISGPCAPLFGPGVEDFRVTLLRPARGLLRRRLMTHTEYWSRSARDEPQMVAYFAALRAALDLRRVSF
ncbi:MAG: hypothetical protein ACRC7C_00055 [Beijerinckiaceae bacterium]